MTQLTLYGPPAASLLLGMSVALLAWWCLQLVLRKPSVPGARYEEERRARMRQRDSIYRWFEPAVDALKRMVPASRQNPSAVDELSRLERALQTSEYRDWRTDEFLASKSLEGLLVGGAVFALVSLTGFGA
ncbi:MAG: hypothetical protein KDA45_14070, partial [Planctomycetales bacterium]|nr:hypothetical protein [Planctomycetales bacterium]